MPTELEFQQLSKQQIENLILIGCDFIPYCGNFKFINSHNAFIEQKSEFERAIIKPEGSKVKRIIWCSHSDGNCFFGFRFLDKDGNIILEAGDVDEDQK